MKHILFNYRESCGLEHEVFAQAAEQLKPEIERVKELLSQHTNTDYSFLRLPTDAELLKKVQAVVQDKQTLAPTALVVVGIGGSNLGALAVHQALYGSFYNEQQPPITCYWADTVDDDRLWDIMLLMEQKLERGENVILNVISKSGTTTETIANFHLLVALLKQYKKGAYADYVVATTDQGSKLWELAQQEGYTCLEVPKEVGGRYSVFSAVGLFPLGMLGVDLEELRAGAADAVAWCAGTAIEQNPAALSAIILKEQYYNGKTIHDTFIFSNDLQGVGAWYRQLMGESIGKMYDRNGGVVRVGITPTVSVGSTDLHSVGQLYLAGPRDKVTTFVSVSHNKAELVVPRLEKFEKVVANIQGKALSSIQQAILQGAQRAYRAEQLPCMTFTLPEKSAYYVGQFMQVKMLEIMYLGFLLEVNPFDQPQVELYKRETRKILNHE